MDPPKLLEIKKNPLLYRQTYIYNEIRSPFTPQDIYNNVQLTDL